MRYVYVEFEFELFNDTWSQLGHSVSYVTISFLCLQITRSDIRPGITWVVSLVIADGQVIFLRGLCGYVWVDTPTIRICNCLGRDDRWLNSIRNPKSKTVLIFFFFFFNSQKTINTLVKSQYISIHLVSFSRVKWQWITSILLLQNITIAQTYQISIHVDYMFSTCWYTLGTNTFSTCCNNPKKY